MNAIFPKCMKEYLKEEKVKCNFPNTNNLISKMVQQKPIPYELFQKHYKEIPKCTVVSGVCESCKKEFIITYKALSRRTRCDIIKHQVCNDCILKYVTNTKEWRKTNSEAQKIAQNRPETREKIKVAVKASKTPEVLKKQSIASKRMWANEEYRKRHRESMKRAFENMSDESYERMTHKNRFYSGWYNSKFGKIYFNSSWELAFIVWCENNKNVMSLCRCKDKIEYKGVDGKKHIYMPDFEIVTNLGTYVIEIKGRYNLENVDEKKKSSDEFYCGKKSYCLWYKRDLVSRGIISNHFDAKKFCESLSLKIEGLYKNGSIEK